MSTILKAGQSENWHTELCCGGGSNLGLERRDGSVFYYLTRLLNGKKVNEYLGSGAKALEAARVQEEKRTAARAARLQIRIEEQKEARWVAEIADYCANADLAMAAVLTELGYHQHNRGEWRRKRGVMREDSEPVQSPLERVEAEMAPSAEAARAAYEENRMARAVEMRRKLELLETRFPDFLAEQAERGLLRKLGRFEGSKTTEWDVVRMQAELLLAGDTPLEVLLVRRLTLCHLTLQVFEAEYFNLQEDQMSPRQLALKLQKVNQAHERYISAIRALAYVRKLKLPAVQVNIGERQMNVANMNVEGER